MNTMSQRLGSRELAVFEALVANARRGLTPPQISRAAGLSLMTVHRILSRFERGRVAVDMGKAPGSKSRIWRLNSADSEVVEIGRAILQYAVRRNKMETRT